MKFAHGDLFNHGRWQGRRCHDGYIGDAVFDGIDRLRRGMIAYFKPDARVKRSVLFQYGKQYAMQGNLACRDKNRPLFKVTAFDYLRFSRLDIFQRYPYVCKKPQGLLQARENRFFRRL